MADLIEYPSNRVKPDFVPQPGDRYEAYGLWHKLKPSRIWFVFPDWTMKAFRCDQMGSGSFSLLNDKSDVHGRCALTLSIGTPTSLYEVVVTGDNIFGLLCNLDAVTWVWELSEDQADAVKEGQPVVHSIEIREQPVRRY